MTLMQYLHTTVYRYYIKQLVNRVSGAIQTQSAIILHVDFRNPRTLTNVDFRNPRTLTSVDFEDITEITP